MICNQWPQFEFNLRPQTRARVYLDEYNFKMHIKSPGIVYSSIPTCIFFNILPFLLCHDIFFKTTILIRNPYVLVLNVSYCANRTTISKQIITIILATKQLVQQGKNNDTNISRRKSPLSPLFQVCEQTGTFLEWVAAEISARET